MTFNKRQLHLIKLIETHPGWNAAELKALSWFPGGIRELEKMGILEFIDGGWEMTWKGRALIGLVLGEDCQMKKGAYKQ